MLKRIGRYGVIVAMTLALAGTVLAAEAVDYGERARDMRLASASAVDNEAVREHRGLIQASSDAALQDRLEFIDWEVP